jgi:hypothetical protein
VDYGEKDYFRGLVFSVTMRDDDSCVNVKNWSHVFPGDLNFLAVQPWAEPEKSPSELESNETR